MAILGPTRDRGETHDLRIGQLQGAGLTEEHLDPGPARHRELRIGLRRHAGGECEHEKEQRNTTHDPLTN